MKLQHIGKYIINPSNIAFIEELRLEDGKLGSRIFFNSYAACASPMGDSAWEMPHVEVEDSPLSVMGVINNEPSF